MDPDGNAELHAKTSFSFLEGASHPDELVARAAELGYAALAVTDRNSLAGVVRAHVAEEVGRYLRVVYVPDEEGDGVFVVTAYPLAGRQLKAFRRRRRRRGR